MLRRLSIPSLIPVLILTLASTAQAGVIEREFTFDDSELKVVNLIGAVRVVAAEGDEFKVHVAVNGEDATEEFLEFETDSDGGDILTIRFPLDKG